MKALVLAAGYGTRFLPITKTIPKEMLPLVNYPLISFVIDELVHSGIKDIIIVVSDKKKSLEDYLSSQEHSQAILGTEKARKERLNSYNDVNMTFVRQKHMAGTGQAILQAKTWLNEDPFIVAYPDDIFAGTPPLTAQLRDQFEKNQKTIIASVKRSSDFSRYGVLSFYPDNCHVKNIVEKPTPGQEPSQEISIGRFLYTHEFLYHLEKNYHPDHKGEYYHIAGLTPLMKEQKVLSLSINQEDYLDAGEPEGYINSFVYKALENEKWKKSLLEFLKKQNIFPS